jgi:plasmid maintenance system antidote protein VapI
VADQLGEVLQHELDAAGVSQAWLARQTGLTTKHINQIIMGRARLSVDVAVRIEMAMPAISAEGLLITQIRQEIADYVAGIG